MGVLSASALQPLRDGSPVQTVSRVGESGPDAFTYRPIPQQGDKWLRRRVRLFRFRFFIPRLRTLVRKVGRSMV
jgi:hypothetical protein